MSKIFKYTKITEVGEVCGSIEEYGDDFEYEVEDEEVLDALASMVLADYFYMVECEEKRILKRAIKEFIEANDLYDILFESYEEDLKDHFKDDAFDWYEG